MNGDKMINGITATVIKDSYNVSGTRLTTFELEYPRFVHSELMTHRMLSKNCASSRAIPIQRINELVYSDPAMPVWWGQNQAGMSAKEELTGSKLDAAQTMWVFGSKMAVELSKQLHMIGLHKQITNRVTEPWQTMKTVISGTEWANFLWLRDHEDAQPEIAELARKMSIEFNNSTPLLLTPGQWHLPYVDDENIDVELGKKISASCCAQVSYRRLDDSLEKALDIYDKLIGMSRKHASPFEHQATPMDLVVGADEWQAGVTHVDRNYEMWSGNFKHWIQHRQLIEGHSTW